MMSFSKKSETVCAEFASSSAQCQAGISLFFLKLEGKRLRIHSNESTVERFLRLIRSKNLSKLVLPYDLCDFFFISRPSPGNPSPAPAVYITIKNDFFFGQSTCRDGKRLISYALYIFILYTKRRNAIFYSPNSKRNSKKFHVFNNFPLPILSSLS